MMKHPYPEASDRAGNRATIPVQKSETTMANFFVSANFGPKKIYGISRDLLKNFDGILEEKKLCKY
jgi:hypothetical protein